MKHILEVKWTTSRGTDTYGYTLVTLRENGKVEARCSGGGYDLHGTVVGEWLNKHFADRLDAQPTGKEDRNNYGLIDYSRPGEPRKHRLDGACGLDCMVRIAENIGLHMCKVYSDKRTAVWKVTDEIAAARQKIEGA